MKVSKFKSRKEWSTAVWQRLLKDIKNPALSNVLDCLLSPYEKNIIVNRLVALSLIKEGKTYKQIGEELWLSPNTVRSLKRTLENSYVVEYQSYRSLKNKQRKVEIKPEIVETSSFMSWIDHCLSTMPQKSGARWKFMR